MASRFQGLTAFERHKRLLREAEGLYGGKLPTEQPLPVKTDQDTLRESYRFLRTEEDDKDGAPWEAAVARKYYSMLFKEYAIIDLSRYKEGKFGCRWRTSKEVIAGKGQFSCGTKGCDQTQALESFEVPFSYVEAGTQKQALVKVRLCQEHSMQLNYKKNVQINKKKRKSEGARRSEAPDRRSKSRKESGEGASAEGSPKEKSREPKRTSPGKKVAPGFRGEEIEAEVDEFLQGLFL